MGQKNTSSGGWIIAISRALDAAGCDSKELFARAGIDLNEAADPNSRFSVKDMARVWSLAVEETGDDAIGLKVAAHFKPTSFHALGYSILASKSLKDALSRLEKYMAVVSNAGRLIVEEEDQQYRVRLQRSMDKQGQPLASDEAVDGFIACLLSICRELYRADFSPLRVELERAAPADTRPYEQVFDCPVFFSAPEVSICFSKAEMDRPLPTANAELALMSDQVIVDYLARLERDDVVSQVQAKVIEFLPKGESSQKNVAEALHLSLRSLQRKLKLAGTSYTEVHEKVRMQLADQYLNQSHLAISEVCFMLGFKSLSSFSRAFKRWTGVSPARYRSEHSNPPN